MSRRTFSAFSAARQHFNAGNAVVRLVLLGSMLTFVGCTMPNYQLAPKDTPLPVLLNLPSTEPPVEALLHTVIIYRGPGSWKRNAFWDEYVVTVANRSDSLLTVESASLTDFRGAISEAGTNPWVLERTSRSLVDQGFGLAETAAIQIGGGLAVVAVGSSVGVLMAGGSYGILGPVSAATVGSLVVLPAFVSGTVYTNISSHRAIEREFERRRLVLPAVLQPGQFVQGSLFFRISPGPKRLTLRSLIDERPRAVVIDLKPIGDLHLRSSAVNRDGETIESTNDAETARPNRLSGSGTDQSVNAKATPSAGP